MISVLLWAAVVYGIALATVASLGPLSRGYRRAAPLARWDSFRYVSIARGGYSDREDGKPPNVAFFPLYPILIAAVGKTTGLSLLVAGEAVSLACLLGAVPLLAALAREEGFDPDTTLRAILFFPASFFFLACYTESLFLLTSVAAFLALRRRRFLTSSASGFFAALTRPMGFLLFLPLVWAARDRKTRSGALMASAGPLAGLATFAIYLWARFGTPLAYVNQHRTLWHNRVTWPWRPFVVAWTWQPTERAGAIAAILFGAIGLGMLKKHTGYAIYILASLALIVERGTLEGMVRYAVVLFPAFFLLGEGLRRSRVFSWAYVAAGLLGLAIYTTEFAAGLWVA